MQHLLTESKRRETQHPQARHIHCDGQKRVSTPLKQTAGSIVDAVRPAPERHDGQVVCRHRDDLRLVREDADDGRSDRRSGKDKSTEEQKQKRHSHAQFVPAFGAVNLLRPHVLRDNGADSTADAGGGERNQPVDLVADAVRRHGHLAVHIDVARHEDEAELHEA